VRPRSKSRSPAEEFKANTEPPEHSKTPGDNPPSHKCTVLPPSSTAVTAPSDAGELNIKFEKFTAGAAVKS
jgi:hypothetical protein